jgi:hypothetical protein
VDPARTLAALEEVVGAMRMQLDPDVDLRQVALALAERRATPAQCKNVLSQARPARTTCFSVSFGVHFSFNSSRVMICIVPALGCLSIQLCCARPRARLPWLAE